MICFLFYSRRMDLHVYIGLYLYIVAQFSRCQEEVCDDSSCKLPDCYCPETATKIPGGLSRDKVPQMVVFTFSEIINQQNYEDFDRLFPRKRKNPNGCSIPITLFVSHNYTDYCMIENMHARGHEIAAFSIEKGMNHPVPSEYWRNLATEEQWTLETQTHRENISKNANIPLKDIVGWRTPFLLSGGDKQFKVLQENGFLYDSTLIVGTADLNKDMEWPFTLDYGFPLQCYNWPCPTFKNFTGLWEAPIQRMSDVIGIECSTITNCINPPSNVNQTYDIFYKNFYRSYSKNRAPVIFNMQMNWFNAAEFAEPGFNKFLDEILKFKDVYVVTISEAIQWMKQPTTLDDIENFWPWSCPKKERKVKCRFRHDIEAEIEARKNPFAGINSLWWIQSLALAIILFILYRKDRED